MCCYYSFLLTCDMPSNVEVIKEINTLKDDMTRQIKELADELRKVRVLGENRATAYEAKVSELTKSVKFLSDQYDGIATRLDSVLIENNALKERNDALISENNKLTKQVEQMEQYSRLNNLEIRGVPNAKDENLVALLCSIGMKVKCQVQQSDIDTVHRIPTPNNPKGNNIIARFLSRDKKNELQMKVRKARLTAKELGLGNEPLNIYFNDHLSPQNKALFSAALKLKKANEWRFLWTDQCVIKARRNASSTVHKIRSEADLRIFTEGHNE